MCVDPVLGEFTLIFKKEIKLKIYFCGKNSMTNQITIEYIFDFDCFIGSF